MKSASLTTAFFLALFALFFGTVFLPNVRLMVFSPLLALVYMRKSFHTSLWIATLCGMLIDFANTEVRFGLFALGFLLTTCISYPQKHSFFEESIFSLPLFTLIISFFSSISLWLLMALLHQPLQVNFQMLLTNFLFMPFLDATYAILWFTCPILVYTFFKKKQKTFA